MKLQYVSTTNAQFAEQFCHKVRVSLNRRHDRVVGAAFVGVGDRFD